MVTIDMNKRDSELVELGCVSGKRQRPGFFRRIQWDRVIEIGYVVLALILLYRVFTL